MILEESRDESPSDLRLSLQNARSLLFLHLQPSVCSVIGQRWKMSQEVILTDVPNVFGALRAAGQPSLACRLITLEMPKSHKHEKKSLCFGTRDEDVHRHSAASHTTVSFSFHFSFLKQVSNMSEV